MAEKPFPRPALVVAALFLAGAVAAASPGGTASAAESPVVVGIRGGVDVVAASQYTNQPESVTGDLFVRFFPGPSVAVEATVGYRSASYDQASGLSSSSFSIRQVPIMAGAAWVFLPGQAFRPRLGAGIAVLPTRTKSTTSLSPGREETFETSSTVIGGYVEGGLQAPIQEKLMAEVSFRYVLNPVPQESGKPSSQNYFSALFGLSARF